MFMDSSEFVKNSEIVKLLNKARSLAESEADLDIDKLIAKEHAVVKWIKTPTNYIGLQFPKLSKEVESKVSH